jgi:hypothetical protein
VVTITITPESALVNGVQIHGRVDPAYLRLIRVQPVIDTLPHVLDPVSFDPATGIFRYGAGILSGVITKPFAILILEIEAVAATTITGTEIAFLFDFPPTDISGLSGSVLDEVQNGRVFITPAAALQASLNLQGRPADKAEPAWAIPLTVTLTEVGQETSRTFTPTTAQGRFTLPFIKPGLYDIQVKGHHTLRHRAENVEIKQGTNSYFLGTLLEGDVEIATTFNQVVLPDFGLLSSSFNKCPSEPGYIAQANLNEHGCVTLIDFGLLSGNFNKQGDILNIAVPNPPPGLLQARTGQALLAFNVEDLVAEVNQVVSITAEVEPRGEQVNGAMVHLGFDPALLEIVAVQLAEALPISLVEPEIDNQQGRVQFGAGILGQTLNRKFPVATLFVRAKIASPGATITPLVDIFPPTEVSGPTGSVLGETRGVRLKATASGSTEPPLFLPIIIR